MVDVFALEQTPTLAILEAPPSGDTDATACDAKLDVGLFSALLDISAKLKNYTNMDTHTILILKEPQKQNIAS